MTTPAADRPAPLATPELDKRSVILEDASLIGEFLDFLDEQGITLCRWNERQSRHFAIGDSESVREQLLAVFFNIDLDKVEAERRAILAHLRAQQ